MLQDGVRRIREAGGVPVLCHPCWHWTYDHETVLAIEGATHFEVWNCHPDCNARPVAGLSAGEEIWDKVLSAGMRIFGTASDDAHYYGSPEGWKACPLHIPVGGTGWNVVNR